MATKPKIPKFDTPVVDASGRMNPDWYKFFSQIQLVGSVATTATGGAATLPANPVGFFTVYENGTERKAPFYAV